MFDSKNTDSHNTTGFEARESEWINEYGLEKIINKDFEFRIIQKDIQAPDWSLLSFLHIDDVIKNMKEDELLEIRQIDRVFYKKLSRDQLLNKLKEKQEI